MATLLTPYLIFLVDGAAQHASPAREVSVTSNSVLQQSPRHVEVEHQRRDFEDFFFYNFVTVSTYLFYDEDGIVG